MIAIGELLLLLIVGALVVAPAILIPVLVVRTRRGSRQIPRMRDSEHDPGFPHTEDDDPGILDVSPKRDAWARFAEAQGGDFQIRETVDVFDKEYSYTMLRLSLPFLSSQICFVETDAKPLKVTYPVDPDDGFRFTIWPQDFVDGVMHILGAQDVVIGDDAFDKEFAIKANDERRVKHLLESVEIRSFLLAGRYPFFGMESSEEGAQLRMTVNRTTETQGELDSLFSFFCAAIRRVRESGKTP